jgi:hypothetical protein
MKFVTTLSLAWCLIASSHASAFEVNGFHTGMALDEVRKVAEKYGEVYAVDQNTYLVNNPLRTYTSFRFCHAKLISLEQDEPVSVKQLALLVAKFNKRYGQPASVKAGPHADPMGQVNEIRIGWRVGSEYVSVNYKGSQENETLSTSYQADNKCFDVPK